MAMARRWFLELISVEGRAQLQFGYSSFPGGTVTWDTVEWPVDWSGLTERQILSELHDGALVFMERRA